MNDFYLKYRSSVAKALEGLEVTDKQGERIPAEEGFDRLNEISRRCQSAGQRQYLCGNGASAAFCNHMALDWSKNGEIPTISFGDSALLTAVVNDLGGDAMFSAPLRFYAQPGDILATVSSSGNSANILAAIDAASDLSLDIVTFSGLKPDNLSRRRGILNFYIPAMTYGVVECAHQVLLHVWLDKFMDIREWEKTEAQNMNMSDFRL